MIQDIRPVFSRAAVCPDKRQTRLRVSLQAFSLIPVPYPTVPVHYPEREHNHVA
jgi:hypothetical protein